MMKKDLLGEKVHIGVGSYSEDLKLYYSKLGYRVVIDEAGYLIMNDNSISILLNKAEEFCQEKYCLVYYTEKLNHKIEFLKSKKICFQSYPDLICGGQGIEIANEDGATIFIVESKLVNYPNLNYIMLNESEPDKRITYPNNQCGLFGELSFPVNDILRSIAFWQSLNFNTVIDSVGKYPWAILTDGLTIIGLHQTSDFNEPMITYFANNMADRIRNIRAIPGIKVGNVAGISNTEKAALLTAPNNLQCFLFTL